MHHAEARLAQAAKIAPGAVSSTHLAANAISFSNLQVPAAPSAGQVLSYNGSSLNWTNPGGGRHSVAMTIGPGQTRTARVKLPGLTLALTLTMPR